MKIIFTEHAEDRLNRIKISREEVIDAVKYPEKIIKKYGKYYFRKNIGRGVIEVSTERTERYIRIITVYWI